MKKMENKGFYACAVWCNGEYQKGATRFYNDDEEFNSVVANAYSGCIWFTGRSEAVVNRKAWDFMS